MTELIKSEATRVRIGVQLATKDSTPQNQDFHRCPECGYAYYANATAQRFVECPYCGKIAPIR